MDTATLDRKFMGRDNAPLDLEVIRSEGSYLFDIEGKKYVDFLMGWCVGNLGWNNKVITDAIKNADGPTYVYPHLQYNRWTELAGLLASIAPGNLTKAFRTTGGSESVELALQLAMCYTKRAKFLSIEGSYHGNTLGALSIGSAENKEKYPALLSGCNKIDTPLDEKAARKLETRLKKEDVAAFIMEPVICNLGVRIPDAGFMSEIQDLCHEYGTLLIMDEVATGFGRTGKIFASEHFGLHPDILCLSKAITGGHAGMGAVMTTARIANAVKDDLSVYSTYGWHPLSVEAAIANIGYMVANKDRLMGNVAKMEQVFRSRLSDMNFKHASTINAIGLAIGVDVGNAGYAEKIQDKCLKKGLLLDTEDTSLTIFPALNIDEETVHEGLDILEKCI